MNISEASKEELESKIIELQRNCLHNRQAYINAYALALDLLRVVDELYGLVDYHGVLQSKQFKADCDLQILRMLEKGEWPWTELR